MNNYTGGKEHHEEPSIENPISLLKYPGMFSDNLREVQTTFSIFCQKFNSPPTQSRVWRSHSLPQSNPWSSGCTIIFKIVG